MKKDYILSEYRALDDFKEYGAEKVPYSGALSDDKLDIRLTEGKLDGYRISNKHTIRESFSVPKNGKEGWIKDLNQAKLCGCKFFRRVEMEDPVTGRLLKLIVIDQDYFQELLLDEKD